MRMILVVSALLMISAAAPTSAQAIHPGKHVRIHAPGVLIDRFEGVYVGRSGDTLIFGNDDRGPVRVAAAAITGLEVSQGLSRLRGALRGAFWGGVSMAAAGALLTTDPSFATEDMSKGAFIVASAGQGALLGAIIGAFVPKRVWRGAEPRILLDAATAGGMGARLGLAF